MQGNTHHVRARGRLTPERFVAPLLIVTRLLALAPNAAIAQDMDAHGLVSAPTGSDPGLPVLVPAPERLDGGTGTVAVSKPLTESKTHIVSFMFHDRFSLTR